MKRKSLPLIFVISLLCVVCAFSSGLAGCRKINNEPSAVATQTGNPDVTQTNTPDETPGGASETEVPFVPQDSDFPADSPEETAEESSTQKPFNTDVVPETEFPSGSILPTQENSPSVSGSPSVTNMPGESSSPSSGPSSKQTAKPSPTARYTGLLTPTATIRPTTATAKPTAKPVTGVVDYKSCGKTLIDSWFDSIKADGVMLHEDGKADDYLKANGYTISTTAGYDSLVLAGWLGFDEPISSFGYSINGAAPVYGSFSTQTEALVKSDTFGGQYALRYRVTVPVSNLADGNYRITLVVKLQSGLAILINSGDHPVSFTYSKKTVAVPGLDVTNKTDLVGICYTIWFNQIFGTNTSKPITNVLNIEELMKQYGFTASKGFAGHNSVNKFHFWGEPAQGYYYSTDKTAAKNNLRMIAEAGVDYIIVDMTYASASSGWSYPSTTWTNHLYKPSLTLLDSILELRAAGEKAPYLVFWVNNSSMFSGLKSQLLNIEKYKSCFVYWNGNPFVLVWNYDGKTQYSGLTVRGMNGLSQSKLEYQWSYLEPNNANAASKMHIPVCVATQTTYMSYTGAYGRNGGRFWYNQWKNAFELRPKFVTVTWWNEWAAQLLSTNVGYQFTDAFTMEYSRDIEPMKGGHGDQYYKWLCSYVSAYKAHGTCPKNYI